MIQHDFNTILHFIENDVENEYQLSVAQQCIADFLKTYKTDCNLMHLHLQLNAARIKKGLLLGISTPIKPELADLLIIHS